MKISVEDFIIKGLESLRGLYRYPKRMLGRNYKDLNNSMATDILVFAAHPDDDILGIGTLLYRHSLAGEKITVVFTTNGSGVIGPSWRSKTCKAENISKNRQGEAAKALSLIGLTEKNVLCLGFPDLGTFRYLSEMETDVTNLILRLNPKRIYTHTIEGGHIDHDMTGLVIQTTCKKLGFENIYEWTEYRQSQPLGTKNVKFLNENSEEINVVISQQEQHLKKKMLELHESQGVSSFSNQGESVRKVIPSDTGVPQFSYHRINIRRISPFIKRYLNENSGKTIKLN